MRLPDDCSRCHCCKVAAWSSCHSLALLCHSIPDMDVKMTHLFTVLPCYENSSHTDVLFDLSEAVLTMRQWLHCWSSC